MTGVAIKNDNHANEDIGSQIKNVFSDNRGATDLKMKCSNGQELISSAAMVGRHRFYIE